MSIDWSSLAGETIAGRHVLGEYLSSSGSRGRFTTERGVIEFAPTDSSEGAEMRRRLPAWQRIEHPNLVRVLDAGESELDGVPLVYLVTERVDESVAEVLPERPLNGEEAQQVIAAILPAVAWLHEHGLTHGAIVPENIVAVGNEVKLTSAPVHAEGDPAQDAAAVRATIVELLTQRRTEDAAVLPSPFREIASQATVAGMVQVLRGEPAARESRAPAPAPAPEAVPVATPRQSYEPRAAAVPDAPQRSGTPWWVWAAAAGLAVALLVWMMRKPAETASRTPAPPPVVADAGKAAAPASAPAAPKAEEAKPRGDYAVVAATYRDRDDAARRAAAFRRNYADAGVRGSGRHYMVVVASGLTKAEAERIRRQGRQKGLPRGTYVTKLSRGYQN